MMKGIVQSSVNKRSNVSREERLREETLWWLGRIKTLILQNKKYLKILYNTVL